MRKRLSSLLRWGVTGARRTGGRVARRARTRWVEVRPMVWMWPVAHAATRPGRWSLGVGVTLLATPGPWWLALMGVSAYAIKPALMILAGRHRSLSVVGLSRLVKSMELRRRLARRWLPLMALLGMTREVSDRRGGTRVLSPRLYRLRVDVWGVHGRLSTRAVSRPVDDLTKLTPNIEADLPALDCRIRNLRGGSGLIDVYHSDPLQDVIPVEMLPKPRRALHIVTRMTEEGKGVEQSLPPMTLTVGASRSGKSEEAWLTLKSILDSRIPLRLRVFDPKQQEFSALANAAYDYTSTTEGWPDMLGRAYGALRARQESLARRGIREVRRYTWAEPLDLLILDEFLSVLAARGESVKVRGGSRVRADRVLELLTSQGIAAGFGVLASAQVGQKDVIGMVRDLFITSTCLRVPPQAADMVTAVLGPGAANLYPAHQIPAARWTAGVGYTRDTWGRVVRSRSGLMTPEQRTEVVAGIAACTDRLGGSYSKRRNTNTRGK